MDYDMIVFTIEILVNKLIFPICFTAKAWFAAKAALNLQK